MSPAVTLTELEPGARYADPEGSELPGSGGGIIGPADFAFAALLDTTPEHVWEIYCYGAGRGDNPFSMMVHLIADAPQPPRWPTWGELMAIVEAIEAEDMSATLAGALYQLPPLIVAPKVEPKELETRDGRQFTRMPLFQIGAMPGSPAELRLSLSLNTQTRQ